MAIGGPTGCEKLSFPSAPTKDVLIATLCRKINKSRSSLLSLTVGNTTSNGGADLLSETPFPGWASMAPLNGGSVEFTLRS